MGNLYTKLSTNDSHDVSFSLGGGPFGNCDICNLCNLRDNLKIIKCGYGCDDYIGSICDNCSPSAYIKIDQYPFYIPKPKKSDEWQKLLSTEFNIDISDIQKSDITYYENLTICYYIIESRYSEALSKILDKHIYICNNCAKNVILLFL